MRVEVTIESMHCDGCAAAVERYLRDQPGVEAASIDFAADGGHLEVGPAADVDALVEALDAMGYDASLAGNL